MDLPLWLKTTNDSSAFVLLFMLPDNIFYDSQCYSSFVIFLDENLRDQPKQEAKP